MSIDLKKTGLARVLGLFAASACAPVLAQPGEADAVQLPTLVVSASGVEQKLVDAPASISVISREELQRRPYITLLDAVRDLEGVDVGSERDKTGQGTVSMRGMGSEYTLILLDGRRQNNHGNIYPNNFGGNQFNNLPPLDAIERIEVIRGPASTLYGADAMGGVINLITRKDAQKWSGSVTLSHTLQEDSAFGDDATADLYLSGPLIKGVLLGSVRGSWYDRDASSPTYAPIVYPNNETRVRAVTFGGGGKTVDSRNLGFGGGLTWMPATDQTVTLDYDSYQQKYDNSIRFNDLGEPEYPVGTVDNVESVFRAANFCKGGTGRNAAECAASNGSWERRAEPRVGYSPTQEFTRDTWSLTHRGNWDFGNSFIALSRVATNNEGRTMPFTVAERDALLPLVDGTGVYESLSVEERKAIAEATYLPRAKRTLESSQYTLDAQLDIPFELAGQHVVVIGGQMIRGELKDGVFGMEAGTPDQVQDHNMWSLFAEDTWNITRPLALTAGVRYDDHQVFGSNLSPRLYGVYTVNEAWTFKGGVSTGFKTPRTTDLYEGITGFGGQGTLPLYGNPELKPETSVSTELAVYWQHPTARHNFNITVFHNEFDDKIASQPCGGETGLTCLPTGEYDDLGYANSSKTVNIDKAVVKGVEVAGRYQILQSLGLRANYTLTDSEQKSGANAGLPLATSTEHPAKHMANLTLDWQALNKLNVFLTSEIRGDRYRDWDTVNKQARYYKNYDVFHLGASYKITPNVTLNGRVNNLLNEDFTSYDVSFDECSSTDAACVRPAGVTTGNGEQATLLEHYNIIDKARNYWLSLNVTF